MTPDAGTEREACHGRPTIVLSVNSCWNIFNFRAGLVRGLQADGYRVVGLAPADAHAGRVRELCCDYIELPMDARGTNPLIDLRLAWRYWLVLRRLRPSMFLGFTIKPNIYGSFAAHALGIPVVNNIAGLGTTFLRTGWLNRVARLLYRSALGRSAHVFFQNNDDREAFAESGLIRRHSTSVLPGSGVDLARFAPVPPVVAPDGERPLVALMSARLLWDKGVQEFVDAMRRLKDDGVRIEGRLLGFLDPADPRAVPSEQVEAWQAEDLIQFLGESDDVRPHLAQADVVVLPSYREGTPRSLLEAAAMGKPIITTDTPGCRDVVRPGVNGYLVPPRDSGALSGALARFSAATAAQRAAMGEASRRLAEETFDERFVVDAYRSVLARVSSRKAE